MIRALALISGGLDSLLACRLIENQGIEVVGVHFKIPFCKLDIKKGVSGMGIELVEFDLGEDFLSLIGNPRYGFGARMNPCIDCKILMFKRAKALLEELNADFVISGEVLGQRPMSQNKQALNIIQQRSGLGDLLLRPLSARFFEPSLPEREGWVNRDLLLDFNGRVRAPQIRLARELGIEDYLTPAGGCLLTDPCFSRRLEEALSHDELSLDNLELLKVGRHFRLGKKLKLVVGRNKNENGILLSLARDGDCLFFPHKELAGPVSLTRGVLSEDSAVLSSRITCAYSDTGGLEEISVFSRLMPGAERIERRTTCFPKENFAHLLI
ncbi:MAG: tRNA 4-thiouridine(8) synthase ThiI [Candidatus Omnitrophica bacterium]|nr:tRNA 4-thiouridine(8) synthase ThiI [Candidatus Omnitrophota bacterium]MDD5500081.1 tRNA 4-thiouridine(8) synthase ThiI [Candidatus Omnitrophota bacterium]